MWMTSGRVCESIYKHTCIHTCRCMYVYIYVHLSKVTEFCLRARKLYFTQKAEGMTAYRLSLKGQKILYKNEKNSEWQCGLLCFDRVLSEQEEEFASAFMLLYGCSLKFSVTLFASTHFSFISVDLTFVWVCRKVSTRGSMQVKTEFQRKEVESLRFCSRVVEII